MAPGHTGRFRFVDVIRTHHRRVREGRGIGNEGFKKLAGIAHGNRIWHHCLRRFQIFFRGQPRPSVKQLAMHDRTLQHHRTRADGVKSAIVVEGEHARCDQHELVTARWKVKMEIGGAGVGEVNRQICRNLVEQEGFVVRMEAFVRAIVEGVASCEASRSRSIATKFLLFRRMGSPFGRVRPGHLRSTAACTFMTPSNLSISTRSRDRDTGRSRADRLP